MVFVCSHRDLNPGCGVESPASLAELDDRSASVYTHIPLHSIMPYVA